MPRDAAAAVRAELRLWPFPRAGARAPPPLARSLAHSRTHPPPFARASLSTGRPAARSLSSPRHSLKSAPADVSRQTVVAGREMKHPNFAEKYIFKFVEDSFEALSGGAKAHDEL